MSEHAEYVVLEWVEDLPEFPRYSFATLKHAEELGPDAQWLQTYSSLEMAAEATRELNWRNAAAQDDGRRYVDFAPYVSEAMRSDPGSTRANATIGRGDATSAR
jgi:hypothetical protein